jgi:hypothetical protein
VSSAGELIMDRTSFRNQVFRRDNHKCILCTLPAKDAHHIIERRLWSDGGYYVDNGVSVCEPCHIECEKTNISVEQVREAAGITNKILPPHLYSDEVYDKWGNMILPNGQRLRGELFEDESVQRILGEGNKLQLFTNFVKYPRTYHCPWSENMNPDDRMIESLEEFENKRVIVTIKMDGENTTLYNNYIHARSLDSRNHPSRNWVKNFHATIAHEIPVGYRVCGENLYAKHSIKYDNLLSYFYGFSLWQNNKCLGWDETLEWFSLLGITSVPVLYDGIFNIDMIQNLWYDLDAEQNEGYVIRVAESFQYKDFRKKICKFVRKNHLQTIPHGWTTKQTEKNSLAGNLSLE